VTVPKRKSVPAAASVSAQRNIFAPAVLPMGEIAAAHPATKPLDDALISSTVWVLEKQRAYQRAYIAAHRRKHRQASAQWRKRNPEYYRSYYRKHRRKLLDQGRRYREAKKLRAPAGRPALGTSGLGPSSNRLSKQGVVSFPPGNLGIDPALE
jgi:hypothetical protein